MTDDYSDLTRLQLQFETKAKMDALSARYEAFLSDRGLDFTPESEEQRSTVARWRITILYVAAIKMIFNVHSQRLSREEVEAARAKDRLHLISKLWHDNLWSEPWLTLINQEFPGDEITPDDMEQIITAAPEVAARQLKVNQQYEETQAELVLFLIERGYDIQDEDMMILIQLTAVVGLHRNGGSGSKLVDLRLGDLLQDISHRASDPQHAAWQELIQHFLQGGPG